MEEKGRAAQIERKRKSKVMREQKRKRHEKGGRERKREEGKSM